MASAEGPEPPRKPGWGTFKRPETSDEVFLAAAKRIAALIARGARLASEGGVEASAALRQQQRVLPLMLAQAGALLEQQAQKIGDLEETRAKAFGPYKALAEKPTLTAAEREEHDAWAATIDEIAGELSRVRKRERALRQAQAFVLLIGAQRLADEVIPNLTD